LLTVAAIWGYRLYAKRRIWNALPLLGAYSLLGLTSPLHFVGGVPDIPPFFMTTIFTDGLTGAAVLWFVFTANRHQRTHWRTSSVSGRRGKRESQGPAAPFSLNRPNLGRTR